ncbi:MAG: hypothetical protein COV99_01620 [Bacteroidetes bacterium CG12_big_fil_rev_8_21_14_0_65_60_17]|nr:MAG: hypothetical protein COV99_01620 [Bacteroidetes bacterium CG12_big_fil_rev_8_21_14_0_65_60_17]
MTRVVQIVVSLLVTLILLATQLFAQDGRTGRIIYEETVQLDFQLPPGMESMRDQMPSSRTNRRMLLLRGDELVMRDAPPSDEDEEESGDIEISSGGATIRMQMASGGEAVERIRHTSLSDMTAVEQRDFMGRAFLITESVETPAWRLTSEQSTYEGYLTLKATATVDSMEVVAWFTPEIPVSGGPASWAGLPGLILVLDIDGGERTWAARSIELDVPLGKDEWVRPEKGKKVTRAEYDDIVEERMKEMGARRRGGNGFIFRSGN